MRRNFDPAREFFRTKRKDIHEQMELILQVKHECKFPFGIGNINKSDYYTLLRQCRNLKHLLRWYDVFRDRRIVDVGAGIGAAYLGLRFCDPTELIAMEPNQENYDFLRKHVPYDKICRARWQDYDFKYGDCVLVRNVTIENWYDFIAHLRSKQVTDVIIIERFVNLSNHSIFYHAEDTHIGPKWTPGRMTYDRRLDEWLTPSIGYIRHAIYQHGYALMNKDIYANPGHTKSEMPFFSLHLTLVEGR